MKEIRPDTQTAITEAAFAVLRANPGAGLAEVAARAGVGRATLHRYFKGRADLIATLSRIAADDIETAVDDAIKDAQSAREMLRVIIEVIIPLGDRQSFLAMERVDATKIPPASAAKAAKQAAEFEQLIAAARYEGVFAPDVPTPWIVSVFDQLIFAAWMQIEAGELTQKQAAALAWRSFTNGLGPATGVADPESGDPK